jgi:hypothetical protein
MPTIVAACPKVCSGARGRERVSHPSYDAVFLKKGLTMAVKKISYLTTSDPGENPFFKPA